MKPADIYQQEIPSQSQQSLPNLLISGLDEGSDRIAPEQERREATNRERIEHNEAPDTADPDRRYFHAAIRIVGMGDDHRGNHLSDFQAALDLLKEQGLTHVAMEFIPPELNELLRNYRQSREQLNRC